MYTIEFEAEICDGIVRIPERYALLKNGHARVVVLVGDEESLRASDVRSPSFTDCDIQAFAGKDGLELQREMRDDW